MYPARKSNKRKKIIISLLVLVFAAGLGFGGWYLYLREEPPVEEETTDESVDEEATEEVELLEYSSDDPALSFSYPSDWSATEEDGTILLHSPEISYQRSDGTEVDGYFRIFLRQTAREEDSRYIARGVAALPSETLTYSDPSSNQREETSISYFGIDNRDNFGFFFIAGNFSLDPGDILGANYGREDGTYIIGGGYSSDELSDDLATHPVPLDEFDQKEIYEQALDIIRSIRIG